MGAERGRRRRGSGMRCLRERRRAGFCGGGGLAWC